MFTILFRKRKFANSHTPAIWSFQTARFVVCWRKIFSLLSLSSLSLSPSLRSPYKIFEPLKVSGANLWTNRSCIAAVKLYDSAQLTCVKEEGGSMRMLICIWSNADHLGTVHAGYCSTHYTRAGARYRCLQQQAKAELAGFQVCLRECIYMCVCVCEIYICQSKEEKERPKLDNREIYFLTWKEKYKYKYFDMTGKFIVLTMFLLPGGKKTSSLSLSLSLYFFLCTEGPLTLPSLSLSLSLHLYSTPKWPIRKR